MDLDILLALQNARNAAGPFLTDLMKAFTFLGELNTVLALMAAVYWCLSKEIGTLMLMGWSGNRLVNGVLKVSACVYRPWIRSGDIIPADGVKATATGYSFPSGHSTNAAAAYGAPLFRRELPLWLKIISGLLIALVMLSRCFLGVHTPQDVLVGAGMGLLVMYITSAVLAWLADHPEKDLAVVTTGLILGLIIAVYAGLKPYPTDYDEAGKLLVDGAKMANDTFKGVGWCAGFLVGWLLERRFVGFSTDVPLARKLLRLIPGAGCYLAISDLLVPQIKAWIPGAPGTLYSCFFQMLFIALIFPWLMKAMEDLIARKTKEKKA